ncbi:hypothetical protein [Cohnella sp. GCM10027633]|uniref:hypothetical protein n=1 Tax=unclassified Cohnella TaxID=2636738 RepID=UPI00363CC29B
MADTTTALTESLYSIRRTGNSVPHQSVFADSGGPCLAVMEAEREGARPSELAKARPASQHTIVKRLHGQARDAMKKAQ